MLPETSLPRPAACRGSGTSPPPARHDAKAAAARAVMRSGPRRTRRPALASSLAAAATSRPAGPGRPSPAGGPNRSSSRHTPPGPVQPTTSTLCAPTWRPPALLCAAVERHLSAPKSGEPAAAKPAPPSPPRQPLPVTSTTAGCPGTTPPPPALSRSQHAARQALASWGCPCRPGSSAANSRGFRSPGVRLASARSTRGTMTSPAPAEHRLDAGRSTAWISNAWSCEPIPAWCKIRPEAAVASGLAAEG